MTAKDSETTAAAGTYDAPKFHDAHGFAHVDGDVRIADKMYTYRTELGLVVGWVTSVMFSMDHTAKEIWPYLKDFNLWHPKHYYTGVVGDMEEGQTFGIGDLPEQVATAPRLYQIVRVIPEYLMAFQEMIPRKPSDTGLPGIGGISGGFFVHTLHEHAGKTEVVIIMQHASYAARADEADEERAIAKWFEPPYGNPEVRRKIRDDFIPQLRQAVRERRRTRA